MHVLVFFGSEKCGHCRTMDQLWPNILSAIRKKYSEQELKVVTIKTKDFSGSFDYNLYPKDIQRFSVFFPIFMLIDGNIWKEAMENTKHGENNKVKFDPPNISIMNIKRISPNGASPPFEINRDMENKYNPRDPSSFVKWIDDNYNVPKIETLIPPEKEDFVAPILDPEPNSKVIVGNGGVNSVKIVYKGSSNGKGWKKKK